MGTRHLVAVMKNGEYRVAQYGQWDGYPSGQGRTVLRFLREKMRRPAFDEAMLKVQWITQEAAVAAQEECGATEGMFTMSQHKAYLKKYPHLHRDTGAQILELVQDAGGEVALDNAIGFAADSLFCEWAYVVDLDRNTFEIFRGFNKTPLSRMERFGNVEVDEEEMDRQRKLHGHCYYPVRFVREYSLKDLPTEEQFLKEVDPREEEEEEE